MNESAKQNGATSAILDLPRFQPWHELTILAVIGMEMSWVALWFRIFTHTGMAVSFWRAFWVLGGMLVGVYALAHLLNTLRIRLNLRRAVLAALLAGGLLIGIKSLLYPHEPVGIGEMIRRTVLVFEEPSGAIPSEFAVALAVVWVWWRAVYLAGREVESALVRQSFYIGLGMLFAYGLIAPATGEKLAAPLYLFLFSWLSAMSAARIYRLARFGRGQAAAFDRKWLAGILSAVVGVVGIAALAGSLMEWKISALLVILLIWLFRLLVFVVALLMSPLILLLSLLTPLLREWLKNWPETLKQIGEALQEMSGSLQEMQESTPDLAFTPPAFLRPAILWGILGLAVLIAVWMLHKRYLKSLPPGEEQPETILSRGELLRQLLSALRSGAQSMVNQFGALGLGNARRFLAAARIRRIYARLMDLSADLGKPRPLAYTPLEYLPLLDKLFPNHAAELRLVTGAYLRVRYGELPETRQEVEQVETAWKQLKEQGRVMQEYARMRKVKG
jgi:hypothetical protein